MPKDIICYRSRPVSNTSWYEYTTSEGGSKIPMSLDATIDFLLYSCATTHRTGVLRVVWDLTEFADPILRFLSKSQLQQLHKDRKIELPNTGKIYYIPGKLLSLKKSGSEINIYDLSQYFPEDPEPRNMKVMVTRATELIDTLIALGIGVPSKLTSPIAVFEGSALDTNISSGVTTIHEALDSQLDAYEYAFYASGREWASSYQIGHWENNLWSYDLSSAYPAVAADLIDLRDCDFVRSKKVVDSARYGLLYGSLYINPDHPFSHSSPALIRRADGTLVNGVGHLPDDYYTIDTVRHCIDYYDGDFKVIDGWYMKPYSNVRPRYVFRDVVDACFVKRSVSSTASFFLKRVMNGMIGRLLEIHKDDKGNVREYGKLFNSIYHATILTRAANKVSRFIIENELSPQELVVVAIDEVKTTRYLPIPEIPSLGKWRSKGESPTIVLSPSLIYTPTRAPGGMNYYHLRSILEAFPGRRTYELDGWSMGIPSLKARQNRVFSGKFPKTGRDILTNKYISSPYIF